MTAGEHDDMLDPLSHLTDRPVRGLISGLQEGEEVAMLAALSLQAQRQQQNDRMRQNMGGGVPGMSAPGGGGGAQGGQRPGGGR